MRIFLAIVIMGSIIGCVYWYVHGGIGETTNVSPDARFDVASAFSPGDASSSEIISDERRGLREDEKEYKSNKYGFAIFYPNTLDVEEYPGESNSTTVIFKDREQGIGFQIFVVPYPYEKISEERFLADEPSGVMKDPVNITVNGAAATAFTSRNDAMGETWEVWFLHGGYLYEVTAPLALKEWVMAILETWHFI